MAQFWLDEWKNLRHCHNQKALLHDDVVKWNYFPRSWPFVRGIHRSPVNSPHKGQWRGTLMFSLICTRINCCVNNREAGDLRRHLVHYYALFVMHRVCAWLVWPLKTPRLKTGWQIWRSVCAPTIYFSDIFVVQIYSTSHKTCASFSRRSYRRLLVLHVTYNINPHSSVLVHGPLRNYAIPREADTIDWYESTYPHIHYDDVTVE